MRKLFASLVLFLFPAVICAQAPTYYPPYGYPPQGVIPQQQQYSQQQRFPRQQQYPQQQYPGQYPGGRNSAPPQPYWTPHQQQVQKPDYTPPRIETSVSDTTPYEQQSLVYRIRIIGDGNLKTVMPVIPQSSDLVLRPLGEPLTERGRQKGAGELVTEYRYLLMPLSSGRVQIPPARITGRFSANDGGNGPTFDVSGKAMMLHVRPATDAVQPWLPLYNLEINAEVRDTEAPAAGNPIELEVETLAEGATGSQIPSVASYLKSEHFRIYPGESISEGNVSPDGKMLQGRRVETFTLVPRYGGVLELPNLTINWWNVRYNRPEVAALLSDQINVMGPANRERSDRGTGFSLTSAFFWLPMGIGVGIAFVGWWNAFMGDGKLPGAESVRNFFKPILGEMYAPLVALAIRISPRRRFHRLRTWTGRQLPVSWKLWFCLRAVAREDDPAEWAHALQILAAKHLGVRPQANLRQLGEGIVRCHPRANASQVDRLMSELDAAVYGSTPMRSFAHWKDEFRAQIKPGLFPIRSRQSGNVARVPEELPGLNPQ